MTHSTDLTQLLAPKSVALIGASDNSRWSQVTFRNLIGSGFAGTVHLVNRRGGTVHGRAAATSCAELDARVDTAIVMVPLAAVEYSLREMIAAGIRNAVILTSGFAEAGEDGAAAQQRLTALAMSNGVSMLGPNSLGFVNFADNIPLWTAPYAKTRPFGRVAVISHSGQVAFHLNNFAVAQGMGLSHLITTGNEAGLDFTDFVDHLLGDDRVESVALYLETIRRPERFVEVASKALAMGKSLVVLKIGASEVAARTAQAHTGALVGDDASFGAICNQFGVVRVKSIEDLLCTADLISRTGVLLPGGVGFVSNSGGVCGIAADTAAAMGVEMPPLSAATADRLKLLLPAYATVQNPLDITGAAAADRSLFESTLKAMCDEPRISILVCFADLPNSRAQTDASLLAGLRHMGLGVANARIPAFIMNCLGTSMTSDAANIAAEFGLPFVAAGLQRGIAALSAAMWWSARYRQRKSLRPHEPMAIGHQPASFSEFEALKLLAASGVPTVSATLATTAQEAISAARNFDSGVAVKVCSAGILHKTEIGGVALDVRGDEAVGRAFLDVQKNVPRGVAIDGVLIAPMRRGGLELFVGISRNPAWGTMLAVGLGGVWIEALHDVSLRRLPVDAAEVEAMLRELKGAALLDGIRGTAKVDVPSLARLIARIGAIGVAFGSSLETLEINPLLVDGKRFEALDAVIVNNLESARP